MSDDGIASVYDGGIIPPFIKHTHIHAEVVGDVDGTAHSAFVGADHHQMIAVDGKIRFAAQKSFDKLISRLHCFKAVQGNRILHPGVVGVEGDDVFHSHAYQLLQRIGAVQGFSSGTLMLAALI